MNLYADSYSCFLKANNKYTKFLSLIVLMFLLMPAMANAEPAHYRITGNGGWEHFKLGHNTETLWRPKVSPAVGQTQLELTLNGNGSTDWSLISVRGKKNRVILGDYITGNPEGFFTVVIPLSAFENGSFDQVANFSIPYANGPEHIDISVARVAFTGGSDPYVWFDQEANVFHSRWQAQFVAATDDPSSDEKAATIESSYYEIRGNGGWNHFKLGHNPDNLWSPKISPAEGKQFLRLTLNGFGNTDWNQLTLNTNSSRLTLGDYIEGQPQGWFSVDIPLSEFPASAFRNISQMSIPHSRGTDSIHIGLARVEFIGENDNFLWFGAPDKTLNAYSTPWSVDTKVAEIPAQETIVTNEDSGSAANNVDECANNACNQPDSDNDGVIDSEDNCPADANADQADTDNDGIGDACDIIDADNDNVADSDDNCPADANADQVDSDNDGIGDACDIPDADGDNIADSEDNCPADANTNQADSDNDGIGDACDIPDADGDNIADSEDNCPADANANQADSDNNGIGDACDMTEEDEDHETENADDEISDHYSGTPDIDDSFGAVVAPDRSGASWSAVASYYRDYPPLFGECSEEQHAKYWVKGADGDIYPTWHPPVDPSGCRFGHEHGDDPRSSDLYQLSGGIPFGFVHGRLMHGGGMGDRQEDHVGHKIVMRNNWTAVAGNPANSTDLMAELGDSFECDWLSKVHQGTHSSDALGNNMHEYFLNLSCKDGTHVSIKELAAWGEPSSFYTECSDIEGGGEWIHGGFDSSDTPIVYPNDPDPTNDDTSETGFLLNDGKRSVNCLSDRIKGRKDLFELWKADGHIRSPQGGSVHFSPYYIIKNPNRYFDWQWQEHGLDNAMISSVDICVRGSEVWDKVIIPEHPEFRHAGHYPPLCYLNNLSSELRSQWEAEIEKVKNSELEGDDLEEALTLLSEKRRFHKDNPFDGSRRVTQPKRIQIYNNYSRQNTPEGHTKFCTNAFGKAPVWPDEDGICPHGTLEQIISSHSNNWDSISFTTEDGVTIRGISGSSINGTHLETGAIQNPNDNDEVLISPGIGEEWIRDISQDRGVHAPN